MPPSLLPTDELEVARRQLPDWRLAGRALLAGYRMPDFHAAVALWHEVAAVAEAMQHHPDFRCSWTRVEFALSTHDAGGITALDVRLAGRIAALAAALGGTAITPSA